jgi:hypothetical protein
MWKRVLQSIQACAGQFTELFFRRGQDDFHESSAFSEMPRDHKTVSAIVALANEHKKSLRMGIKRNNSRGHRFPGGFHQSLGGEAGTKGFLFVRDHFLEGENVHGWKNRIAKSEDAP